MEIIVEEKYGIPHIDGRLVSYETKKIRSEIQSFFQVNKIFVLPKKYTYVVTPMGKAKIINR